MLWVRAVMSLQRKAIDGVFFPTAPLVAWKLTDIVPHHTIVMSGCGLAPMTMNLKTWNSLPKDVQAVFEEMIPSFTNLAGAIVDDRREWTFEQLKKRGDEVYVLPEDERKKWREAIQPIYDQWVQDMNAKGIDGLAILSKVQGFAEQFEKTSYHEDKWWGDWKK